MCFARFCGVAFLGLNFRNTLSAHGSASVATMDRTMWTDARLDERFNSVDKRFDDLERRMGAGFERVDRDMHEIRTDLRDLRGLMFQLWGTTMVAIVGTIVTVLVTNT